MATRIEPWARPAFRPTGRPASVALVAFADDDILGTDADLRLSGTVPPGAPVVALDFRGHHVSDSAEWIDGWRTGGIRTVAERDLGDPARLDAAKYCYMASIEVDDPADLTHLQLAWAVASALARKGAFAVLDVYAVSWWAGPAVAALAPDRPFTVQQEVSLTAETDPTPGFGHTVHTRGLIKVGRPDLITGVPVDDIQHTAQILNHLGRMLAEGHLIEPGQQFRFDGERTLRVEPYAPGDNAPDVGLNNHGLLLVDV
jgi:hypothetical protein